MIDTILRETTVDGFEGFLWNNTDYGAWDGPLDDWLTSHKEVIESLPNRRTVIQAGGNLGLYPVLLSKLFDKVHTYEADPDNFDILEMNLRRHKIGNAVAWNYAIGETIRQAGIARPNLRNVGMNQIDDNSSIKIRMLNLDSALEFFDNVDLLWLDIEGYELPALEGATQLIEIHRPTIMVERAGYKIENFLAVRGYDRVGESKMDTIFQHR